MSTAAVDAAVPPMGEEMESGEVGGDAAGGGVDDGSGAWAWLGACAPERPALSEASRTASSRSSSNKSPAMVVTACSVLFGAALRSMHPALLPLANRLPPRPSGGGEGGRGGMTSSKPWPDRAMCFCPLVPWIWLAASPRGVRERGEASFARGSLSTLDPPSSMKSGSKDESAMGVGCAKAATRSPLMPAIFSATVSAMRSSMMSLAIESANCAFVGRSSAS
mmetsp:Transcript_123896/g.396686  ORF Transcript_123896/g.396686 Transcript_123896/m.396686 type:complete len:222 (+) Transcript_123896:770-1435(+)